MLKKCRLIECITNRPVIENGDTDFFKIGERFIEVYDEPGRFYRENSDPRFFTPKFTLSTKEGGCWIKAKYFKVVGEVPTIETLIYKRVEDRLKQNIEDAKANVSVAQEIELEYREDLEKLQSAYRL